MNKTIIDTKKPEPRLPSRHSLPSSENSESCMETLFRRRRTTAAAGKLLHIKVFENPPCSTRFKSRHDAHLLRCRKLSTFDRRCNSGDCSGVCRLGRLFRQSRRTLAADTNTRDRGGGLLGGVMRRGRVVLVRSNHRAFRRRGWGWCGFCF